MSKNQRNEKEGKKGKKWFKSIIGVIILIGCIILVLLGIPIIGDLLWHILTYWLPWQINEIGGSIAYWILGIFVIIVSYYGIRYYYEKAGRKTIFIISLFIAVTIFYFLLLRDIFFAMFMSGVIICVLIAIYNGIRWLIQKARRQKK